MFIDTLRKCSNAYGIRVSDPIQVEIGGRNANDLKDALKAKDHPDLQIIVCLYPPPAKKGWYKALKEYCCKERGIPC